MDAKEFWKSRTFWFNLIAIAVYVAGHFGYADFLPDEALMAFVAALVNLILRFVTKEPVKLW